MSERAQHHKSSLWSVQDFDYMVNVLNNYYKCNTGGQPRLMYSKREFSYTVNTLGHCWEYNQPGHMMIKCPDLGQVTGENRARTRTSVACYQRGREKNIKISGIRGGY